MENKKRSGLFIARALLFGVIYAGVYVISSHLPLPLNPTNDPLGVIRIFLVGIFSKFVEQGLIYTIKQSN